MRLKHLIAATLFTGSSALAVAGYGTHPRVDEFTAEVQKDYGIPAAEVKQWLTQAEKMDSVLEAIQRPAEGTMN